MQCNAKYPDRLVHHEKERKMIKLLSLDDDVSNCYVSQGSISWISRLLLTTSRMFPFTNLLSPKYKFLDG